MQKKKKSTKHMGPKPQYTRKEIKGPRIIAAKYLYLIHILPLVIYLTKYYLYTIFEKGVFNSKVE